MTSTQRNVGELAGLATMLHRRALHAGIGHVHPHQLRHTLSVTGCER
jgi:site-specific recombinase XerD